MANVIDDATIDYVGILAKLELSDEEKDRLRKIWRACLIILTSLMGDTTGVEPMSPYFLLKV